MKKVEDFTFILQKLHEFMDQPINLPFSLRPLARTSYRSVPELDSGTTRNAKGKRARIFI